MNLNNVITLPVADGLGTTVTAYKRVRVVSDGGEARVALANAAPHVAIGTVLQDTDATHPDKRLADIQLTCCGVHYAHFDDGGTNTTVAIGELITGFTGGLVAHTSNAELAHGVALEAGTDGDIIRVLYYDHNRQTV